MADMDETKEKTFGLVAEPAPDFSRYKVCIPGAWRVLLDDGMPLGHRRVVADDLHESVAKFLAEHAVSDAMGRIVGEKTKSCELDNA